jgi:hypothetical protein
MMKYNTVEGLQVLTLPRIAQVLNAMVRDGIPDPVNALRRLQGGSDEPELAQYAKVFDTLRGVFTFGDNAAILEAAMREAVSLAGAVI